MTNNQIPQLALDAIHKIIDEEGGFVYTDQPVDPDRGTYAGIRYITFVNYMVHHHTDYSILTPTEFRKLALANKLKKYVIDVYYQEYFKKMNLLELPLRLIMPVFSCGVNCGTRKGIKLLQRSCNEMEDIRTVLKIDGINGPKTSSFVHRLCSRAKNHDYIEDFSDKVRNNFIKTWIHYYVKIVNHNHANAVFILGWFNRANKYWVV